MSNQSSTSNDKPQTVEDIIREIEQKSANGDYIYRGENKYYEKVSSTLYRESQEVTNVGIDMDKFQKQMLFAAQDYDINRLGQSRSQQVYFMWGGGYNPLEYTERQFDILAELQHWGGETNLVDFTTDYRVALFFACDGRYNEDGRVILQDRKTVNSTIWNPTEPAHRIKAQKSVFVRPHAGFIQPSPEDVIRIPKNLKVPFLKYLLRQDPPITHESIYNDLHGFIRLQSRYRNAFVKFYIAHNYEEQGNTANTQQARQANYKKAINYYKDAIGLMPNLIMAHINCGIVYGKLEGFDAAIVCFNEALDWEPDNGMAYCNRGIAYTKKGEIDKAMEDLNKATELDPESAASYSNRGNVCLLKGDFNSAIEDYSKAIELEPERAEAYINRGSVYIIIGEISGAIEDYSKAIELSPNLAEAYTGHGVAYMQKGDFDQAIRDFTQAIQLKQDYVEAYNNLGSAYESKGDFDQAIRNYTQAIEFKSDYAKAYSNRSMTLLRLQEWEKAKTDLITAQSKGLDITAAFHNSYRSIEAFERIIGLPLPADIVLLLTHRVLEPNNADTYVTRGIAHLKNNDHDLAIRDFSKAIELDPEFVAAYYNLGLAYSKKGKVELAIENYTKTIELNPNDAEAYYNRGGAFLRLGKHEKAESDLTIARNMGGEAITALDKILQDYDRAWKVLGNL